jgi:hypothetical protein
MTNKVQLIPTLTAYTNPVIVARRMCPDYDGKVVEFLQIEHDEPFPYIGKSNPRRRTWLHPDYTI